MTTGFILTMGTLAALLAILVFVKVHPARKPSLEGIEDAQAAQAYERISKWPQFRVLRRLIVREIRKHRPAGILADK
jgi:hypothetical protein